MPKNQHLTAVRQYHTAMEEAKDLYNLFWLARTQGMSVVELKKKIADKTREAAVLKQLCLDSQIEEYTEVDIHQVVKETQPSQDLIDEVKCELSKNLEGKSTITLINGIDVEPKDYDWITPHWLVRGEIHLLAGVAKRGKTGIALKLAAEVTRGNILAGKYPCKQGKVLVWSGEDDLQRTIVPRLQAMDADMGNIRFIHQARVINGEIEELQFYLDKDLSKLNKLLSREKDIQLVILDPIVGIAAKAKDGYNPVHIREAMEPLIAMTRKHGIATLGITHFKKGGQGSVLDRIIGSQAWSAIARVVLVADYLKAEDTHVLCRAHCNFDAPIDNIEYTLASTDDGILKIEFGQHLPGGVEVLEAQGNFEDPERRASLEVASEFLLDYLENVPGFRAEWKEILAAGEQESLTKSTLRRARDNLRIQDKIMRGRVKNERGGKTRWYLADHGPSENDNE